MRLAAIRKKEIVLLALFIELPSVTRITSIWEGFEPYAALKELQNQ